jgi:hypothetical protein
MTPRQSRVIRQYQLWVNGISEHNHVDNECCIDFSCCHPDLGEKDQAVRVRIFTEAMRKLARLRQSESERGRAMP